ncbi:MAG: selenium-dependent xanthine dehydrogenase, partial [Spirochaetes bacterium]|nr:selenium-dependent xanthine dehydrogenase [Candidatus Ornithospirochaeta stercoravium]
MITINGIQYSPESDTTLLDYLRNTLHLTGTKDGCSEGACGACSVIINGKLRRACREKLSKLENAEIITIEGLSEREKQVYSYAFAKRGAVQCGFCTPGMVMAAKALIDSNPSPSEEDIRKAIRGNICRCTGYKKIEEAILLASEMFRNNAEIPAEDMNPRLSGNMKRLDADEKTLGTGIYTDDIHIDGMLYGSALRSPKPRIRLINLDTSEALKDEDCVRIITAEDVPVNAHGHIVADWPVLIAKGKTSAYTGDALCLVIASKAEALERIKGKIHVEYEELDGVYSPEEAAKDEIEVHEGRSNLFDHEHVSRGNAEKALSESDYIVDEIYTTPFTEHAFMEPECAVAVPYKEDGVFVYASDQSVFDDQREIARMLGIDKSKVRVRATLVGGGFGGKEDMSVQHHAALAAWLLKKPVKIKLSRQESLIVHPKRHPMKMHIRLGADKTGRIKGMKAEIIADTGAYASLGGPVLQRACTHASGPYNYQNFEIDGYGYYTNNVPSGAFRGFGVTQSCFAIESALDEMAKKVGIDPFEIRMINALKPGDVMPNGQIAGIDTGIVECLKAAKEAYYSSDRTGIALAMKNSGIGVGSDDTGRCILSVEEGKIHIRTSAACMGQGLQTVMLQIAAETLGLKPDMFIVEPPDTERTPDSGTSTASRQTAFTGEAVRRSALKLKDALTDHTLSELEGQEYYGEFIFKTDPITSTKPNPVSHLAYSYSAQVAELDENNRVKKITAVCDAGTVINRTSIEGQVEG